MWSIFQRSVLFHAALLVLIVFVGVRSYQMVHDAWTIRRTLDENQKKADLLIEKKHALDAAMTELDTPEAVERIAKERLNLKERGEEVVVVPPVDSSSSTAPVVNEVTWWQKIFLFLHKQ